ncbi:MAG: prolipoprotein diacylglyceryl transferase [Dethiobacteria bacterium]|jgi:phosphatidylglycerol:prolipoprotein diacylglycerol transferase
MHPIIFKIGDFPIYAYGVALFVAFSVGIIWSLREAETGGVNQDYLYEVILIGIVLALLGSRLTYVFLNWDFYRGEPWWKIFAFREGGLTFYGGLLAALLGGYFYCLYRKISFLKLLDFVTPFIALGYAITRIGCFLNGCCYGKVTSLPWGLVYPAIDNLPRHPTQLYASFSALLIFLLLRYLRKFKTLPGFIFAWFLIFYGIYRFVVEFFRVSLPTVWFLTPAQAAALVFILAGGAMLLVQQRQHQRQTG